MADVGLLPEGFVPQTTAEARAEIEAEIREEFGQSFPLGDGTFAGHVTGIISERLGLLWEVAEISFSSFDPDANSGAAQRAVGAITGTFEIPESSSMAIESLCGDDGTVIAAGNIISTSAGKRFATSIETTLDQQDAWLPTTGYEEGEQVTNEGRCYRCIESGTSVGSGGPATTDNDITDGTVHWIYLGDGEAWADVFAVCEEIGPVTAVAFDLTNIETPLGGWNTARNIEDAELGRTEMTDEAFRLLREQEIAQPGTGTADAVRAALLQLVGVTSATVFFNTEDEEDEEGLPPHSCEALVLGGDDQDIWDCLWANVPLGIATYGDEEGTAVDSEGFDQIVRFSRPEVLEIYIIADLLKLATEYGGDDAVKASIIDGAAEVTGKDVVASKLSSLCFEVDGVIDVTSMKIGTAPTPTLSTTVVVTRRQLAEYDTSRITVNSTDGEE